MNATLILIGVIAVAGLVIYILFQNRKTLKAEIKDMDKEYTMEILSNAKEIVYLNQHVKALKDYIEAGVIITKENTELIEGVLNNDEISEADKDTAVGDLLSSLT